MGGLSDLGLSQYEEAVYKALLRLGRADAKKISLASCVPPTAVYPNLKTLVRKGLVQRIDSEVALYEPLDPKIALAALLDRKKSRLEEEYGSAMAELNAIKRSEDAPKEPVTVSTGREVSFQIFADLAEKARKSVYIMGWSFYQTKTDIALLKRIRSLVAKKVDVRLITNNTSPMKNHMLREIRKLGVPMRFYPVENFSVVVRDGVETKITLKNPLREPRMILHIDDGDLSAALQEYFLTTWKKAKRI